jgi:hypothetical protein
VCARVMAVVHNEEFGDLKAILSEEFAIALINLSLKLLDIAATEAKFGYTPLDYMLRGVDVSQELDRER